MSGATEIHKTMQLCCVSIELRNLTNRLLTDCDDSWSSAYEICTAFRLQEVCVNRMQCLLCKYGRIQCVQLPFLNERNLVCMHLNRLDSKMYNFLDGKLHYWSFEVGIETLFVIRSRCSLAMSTSLFLLIQL